MSLKISIRPSNVFEKIDSKQPLNIVLLPNELILKIFLNAIALSQAGEIKLKEKTVELIQNLSLICRPFYSLMNLTKMAQIHGCYESLPYLVSTSFYSRPLNLISYDFSMICHYAEALSEEEVYDKTLVLFSGQSPSLSQEKSNFIENVNLVKIYELIISEIHVNASDETEIEDKIRTLLTVYRNETHQLLSRPRFMTLLFCSCSFIPRIFLEIICENANQNQALFDETLEQAARYSHPEITFFILSHKAPAIVVNRPRVLKKMICIPPAPLPPHGPLSSIETQLQKVSSIQPDLRKTFKRTFEASAEGLYVGNVGQLIEDLENTGRTFFTNQENQKDQIALLVSTALLFAHELTVDQWYELIIKATILKNPKILNDTLEALCSQYSVLAEKDTIMTLRPPLKAIVRDAILYQDRNTIASIKRFLSVDVLQQFIDEYTAHYANTGQAGMLDAFAPFIQEHILNF